MRKPILLSFVLSILLSTLATWPLHAQGSSPEPAEGLVVEQVFSGSAAEKAGLRPGDFLLSWSEGSRSESLRSPFELAAVEAAADGGVILRGRRGNGERSWRLAVLRRVTEEKDGLLQAWEILEGRRLQPVHWAAFQLEGDWR